MLETETLAQVKTSYESDHNQHFDSTLMRNTGLELPS